jgi:hypothetical protein
VVAHKSVRSPKLTVHYRTSRQTTGKHDVMLRNRDKLRCVGEQGHSFRGRQAGHPHFLHSIFVLSVQRSLPRPVNRYASKDSRLSAIACPGGSNITHQWIDFSRLQSRTRSRHQACCHTPDPNVLLGREHNAGSLRRLLVPGNLLRLLPGRAVLMRRVRC